MKFWIIPAIIMIAGVIILTMSFLNSPLECSDEEGQCYSTTISRVVNGDTIKTSEDVSVRFALVAAPELSNIGGQESKEYLEGLCPIGSHITIDEDDGQMQGSYGRIIAKVYCNGLNLNGEMVINSHAEIDNRFCRISEFNNESWTGCS